ncbi:hypothetical protein GE061_017551 [Apolygus lucorum]|uniref:Uncharacterized protein n=1 Tax=Apolygus lucorum TaxID=248454 RepID=A0A6A4II00_APOLU|nr:hypothetical protein GE061_017551 [Apolygus lucorum]
MIKRTFVAFQRVAASFFGWSSIFLACSLSVTRDDARCITDFIFGVIYGSAISFMLFKKPQLCWAAKNDKFEEELLLYATGLHMYRLLFFLPIRTLGQEPLQDNATLFKKIMHTINWVMRLISLVSTINKIKGFISCIRKGHGSHVECASEFYGAISDIVSNGLALIDEEIRIKHRDTYAAVLGIGLFYQLIFCHLYGNVYLSWLAITAAECVK